MQCIYKLQSAKPVNNNDNNTFSEEHVGGASVGGVMHYK